MFLLTLKNVKMEKKKNYIDHTKAFSKKNFFILKPSFLIFYIGAQLVTTLVKLALVRKKINASLVAPVTMLWMESALRRVLMDIIQIKSVENVWGVHQAVQRVILPVV